MAINNNFAQLPPGAFDLFRPSRGKAEVGITPPTLYKMVRGGLPIYRSGRMSFISKSELAAFIRSQQFATKKQEVAA